MAEQRQNRGRIVLGNRQNRGRTASPPPLTVRRRGRPRAPSRLGERRHRSLVAPHRACEAAAPGPGAPRCAVGCKNIAGMTGDHGRSRGAARQSVRPAQAKEHGRRRAGAARARARAQDGAVRACACQWTPVVVVRCCGIAPGTNARMIAKVAFGRVPGVRCGGHGVRGRRRGACRPMHACARTCVRARQQARMREMLGCDSGSAGCWTPAAGRWAWPRSKRIRGATKKKDARPVRPDGCERRTLQPRQTTCAWINGHVWNKRLFFPLFFSYLFFYAPLGAFLAGPPASLLERSRDGRQRSHVAA